MKTREREREAAVDMLFKKMGCFNTSFSTPTTKRLYYLWVCVHFLSFVFDGWRLEFLKRLLIQACTSTYLSNALKDIHEVNSKFTNHYFGNRWTFLRPKGTIKPSLSNSFEKKKNWSVSQNLSSWTNCHWSMCINTPTLLFYHLSLSPLLLSC